MPSIRGGLRACSLAVALGLAAASPAAADPPRPWVPAGLGHTVTTDHLRVHFGAAIGAAGARGVAAAGERALARYASLGFPAPVDDGDGHTDIYLMALPASAGAAAGLTRPDRPTSGPWAGAIAIRPEAAAAPDVIAAELFRLVQGAIGGAPPRWLVESTVEWAASTVAGSVPRLGFLAAPGTSLDCVADAPTGCDGDPAGGRRWVFFQALAERYGPAVVRDVLARAATPGSGLNAVESTLAARGSGLADALADLAGRLASGTFATPGLAGRTAWVADTVGTALPGVAVADRTLTADHAGLVFAAVRPTSVHCAPATLELAVDAPSGVPFRVVLAGRGRRPEALHVAGDRASGTFAWSTCADAHALLAIVNAGATDGQPFVVHTRVTAGDPAAPRPASGGPSGVPRDEPVVLYDLRVRRSRARHGTVTVTCSVRASGNGQARVALVPRGRTRDLRLRRGLNRLVLRAPARPRTTTLRLRPYVPATADAPRGPTWGRAVSLTVR